MPLEQQVCSLELAKELEELGVARKSYFFWSGDEESGFIVRGYDNLLIYSNAISIPAYTVAELGEMLPTRWLPVKDGEEKYSPWMYVTQKGRQRWVNTEANARAAMLVYLLENGLLKVEDINK